ncbi:hypothetical protein GCM10020370_56870 [Paenibacillus hodogayensis]
MSTTENNTIIAESARVFKPYPQYLDLVHKSCSQHNILFMRCAEPDKIRLKRVESCAQVDNV